MVTYDFPLHEKIRTLLRLEDLFEKILHFLKRDDAIDHHAALITLFEILEITGRSDLKLELIQELERQRQKLLIFRERPGVAQDILDQTLAENQQASLTLLAMQGKPGQTLRDNGWLTGIKNRAAIPGGACEFDLPAYHYWLHSDTQKRKQDLEMWVGPLVALREALTIALRILRSSGQPEHCVAARGTFQLMMSGRHAQLVRLSVSAGKTPCVPEISANRYALNIRFVTPNTEETRPTRVEADIPFDLTFCD